MASEIGYMLVQGIKNHHLTLGHHVNPQIDSIGTFAIVIGLREPSSDRKYGVLELRILEGGLEGQAIWGVYDHRAQTGCMLAGEPNPQDRIILETCLEQYLAANPPEPHSPPQPLPTTAAYARDPHYAAY